MRKKVIYSLAFILSIFSVTSMAEVCFKNNSSENMQGGADFGLCLSRILSKLTLL